MSKTTEGEMSNKRVGSRKKLTFGSYLIPHCKSDGDLSSDERVEQDALNSKRACPEDTLACLARVVDNKTVKQVRNDGNDPIPTTG